MRLVAIHPKNDSAVLEFVPRVCVRCQEHVATEGDERCDACREVGDEEETGEPPAKKMAFYRQYAEGRGVSWHLSDEEALAIMRQPCVFCGTVPRMVGCIARIAGDDYAPQNCFPACAMCNMIRLDYSPVDYGKICKTIASHRGLVSERWHFPEPFRDSPTVKTYRMYAHGTNRVMALDKPTFDALLLQDCFYCGKANVPGVHCNGVDRIDSRNRRYELSNVVACCKTCNSLKWSLSQDRFLQHVRAVALHFDIESPPLARPFLRLGADPDNPIVLE
jgi:hypothetical protein